MSQAQRTMGTVVWYDPEKGYGFINPDGGTEDVFVHASAVRKSGLAPLKKDQRVEFDIIDRKGNGKKAADRLKDLQKEIKKEA